VCSIRAGGQVQGKCPRVSGRVLPYSTEADLAPRLARFMAKEVDARVQAAATRVSPPPSPPYHAPPHPLSSIEARPGLQNGALRPTPLPP
jgi:hypothetical protein